MGIFGVWTENPASACNALSAMLEVVSGSFAQRLELGEVALAAVGRRASAARIEPGLAAVVQARLDDELELARRFGFSQDRTRPSEAALFVAAYRDAGAAAVAHFDGEFATAIWDGRRRELHLARDVFGVEPLYYVARPRFVAFSSELAALVALENVPRSVDERALVDYLGGFPEDEERTAYAAVRRLPPATSAVIGSEGVRLREYFKFDPERELSLKNDGEYAEALRSELRRAMAARLVSGVRTGVLLSGGLDSSSIACLAAEAMRERHERLDTFSARFELTPECDEQSFQRAVVEATRANPVSVDLDRSDSGADLVQALALHGEPGPIGGAWLAWPLLEEAARRGTRLVLTGVDGDRIVSHGTGHLTELARARKSSELLAELRARRPLGTALTDFLRLTLRARLPSPVLSAADIVRGRPERDFRAALSLIRPELIQRTKARDRIRSAHREFSTERAQHYSALRRPDRTHDLELFPPLERAFGIELRHPFFDKRLVELCLSLPSEQKLRRGVGRYVLRETMRGIVPETVRVRQNKTHFDVAFAKWARRAIENALHGEKNAVDLRNIERFVRISALRSALEATRAEGRRTPSPFWGWPSLPMDLIWRCVVASAWLTAIESARTFPARISEYVRPAAQRRVSGSRDGPAD